MRSGHALTLREIDVVLLVRKAKTNREIANELGLTEGTIKEYMGNIFAKIQVDNRTALALWAQAHIPKETQ